jgi:hypothetical protein
MSRRQIVFGPPASVLRNQSIVSGEGGLLLTIGNYGSQLRPVNYREMCELTLYSARRYERNLSYLGSSF